MTQPDYPSDSAEGRRPRPGRRWWPAVTAVIVIAVAASLIVPAGRRQWALSVFRQPARYTALAFTYAWLLPGTSRMHRRIPLFFSIDNQEGRAMRYRYVLRQVDPLGNSRTLGGAVVTIASGATRTFQASVRPNCAVQPCRVEVLLPRQRQMIDFHVFLRAARKHRRRPARGHRASRSARS